MDNVCLTHKNCINVFVIIFIIIVIIIIITIIELLTSQLWLGNIHLS